MQWRRGRISLVQLGANYLGGIDLGLAGQDEESGSELRWLGMGVSAKQA